MNISLIKITNDILTESEDAFDSDIYKLSLKLWSKIKTKINTLFNNGSATCPVASYEVAKFFKELKYNVYIIDGGYKDEEGHWYPIVTKDINVKFANWTIVDLGNNLENKFIKSGNIEPIITKYPSNNYSEDERLYFKKYITYMNSIGYKFN